jgi:hypothetical protein
MQNIHILSFIRRYWFLLLTQVAASLLLLNDAIFQTLGTLLYPPAMVLMAINCTLLIRHLFYRRSMDSCVAVGNFVRDWHAELTRRERVFANLAVTSIFFLGVCIIVAAVAK